ncbi:hypothetical protein [Streptococcus uberis]|uniref:hypothetical protein n=1 Tax=Streptococcus uberis TaxID=1349 RepID=UPI001939D759|nr:hypothetical protein [Streptococcus uberis]HEN0625041.1 hypothetical protein [Streptococcus agalactiae]
MIAIIRTHEKGRSQLLCELDIMQFTENRIRERMQERGIRDDTFFVCGFSDWGIDRSISLSDCFLLKKCINELYDGNDYIVRFLLRKGESVFKIVSQYYQFSSSDEKVVMSEILINRDLSFIINYWCESITWVNAVKRFEDDGLLLRTEKGFFIRKLEGG